MAKTHKNIAQISVTDAAVALGVSERSVINYIRTREIDAVKVGKKWHVNRASLDAFQQRYGFQPVAEDSHQPVTPPIPAIATKSLSLPGLRCFQLCKIAFEMPKWNPLEVEDNPLKERLLALRHKALESLGSGYHSFHPLRKSQYYEGSRSAVGAILAQLQSGNEAFVASWSAEIAFLEHQLLPAYSSLIKKIERRKS